MIVALNASSRDRFVPGAARMRVDNDFETASTIRRVIMRLLFAGSVVAMVCLMIAAPAHAGPITYTFTGVGNGTVDQTAWSGDFTFVFTTDTANITSGGGEYRVDGIGGTFSEGSFSGTLLSDNAVVVNNDPATPRVGFFNSLFDNGGTIQNSTLTTYHLDTPFGPITGTGDNLLPTLNPNGDGFDTMGGQTVEILGITSLTFTASVPEPSSVVLLGTGLAAIGFFVRRRRSA